MSEESSRRFLERLNSDESFRTALQCDPESALADFELSPTERLAIGTGNEDALRRLSGADVMGFMTGPAAELTKDELCKNLSLLGCHSLPLPGCQNTFECPTIAPCQFHP
jgi:hypothetical protein